MNQSVAPSYASSATAARREGVPAALQRTTHAAHVRINQHPFISGLTRPAYPLEKYKVLLTAYFHLYAAIEEQIDAFMARDERSFDYDARRKLPWLAADLVYLGIDPATGAGDAKHGIAVPVPASPGALIGLLYVIEGATLGGQVVSRHLHETLGVTAGAGASFFGGYGDALETQKRWQQFSAFANSIGDSPVELRAAEISAQGLFGVFEALLNDCHARAAG